MGLRFMGASQRPGDSKIILWGAPLDETTSFRKGTSSGPEKVRLASYGLETYSPNFEMDLKDVQFFDAGDILLPRGNLERSLKNIESFAFGFLRQGKKILTVGGEHLISLPLIRAANKVFPELRVIHLDAHADLRERYLGNHLSHASVMRRVCDFLSPSNIYQLGIRSGTKEEFDFARENIRFLSSNLVDADEILKSTELRECPIYLSIDIDVIDPAFAPGTGTPEPGGILPRELFEFIKKLKGLKIIGADIVEISPPNDVSDITSLLGAKIVREILFLLQYT